jgi:DNA polymerase
VTVWDADQGKEPGRAAGRPLRDPSVQKVAWNVGYERTVLKYKGMDIPIEEWLDVMVLARYAGFPGRLKDCAKVPMIGVPAEDKTKSETLLINKFCKPHDGERMKGEGKHGEDWQRFKNYCRNDVATMRHILNWIEPRFPFPASERELWILDQKINERGLPVDVEMALHGMNESRRIIADSLEQLKTVTGLENPNSVQQLLPWLQEQGYKHDTLGKEVLSTYVD